RRAEPGLVCGMGKKGGNGRPDIHGSSALAFVPGVLLEAMANGGAQKLEEQRAHVGMETLRRLRPDGQQAQPRNRYQRGRADGVMGVREQGFELGAGEAPELDALTFQQLLEPPGYAALVQGDRLALGEV